MMRYQLNKNLVQWHGIPKLMNCLYSQITFGTQIAYQGRFRQQILNLVTIVLGSMESNASYLQIQAVDLFSSLPNYSIHFRLGDFHGKSKRLYKHPPVYLKYFLQTSHYWYGVLFSASIACTGSIGLATSYKLQNDDEIVWLTMYIFAQQSNAYPNERRYTTKNIVVFIYLILLKLDLLLILETVAKFNAIATCYQVGRFGSLYNNMELWRSPWQTKHTAVSHHNGWK